MFVLTSKISVVLVPSIPSRSRISRRRDVSHRGEPHNSKGLSDLKQNRNVFNCWLPKKEIDFGPNLHGLSTWCEMFCCKCQLQKPPSDWLKFFNSLSEAPFLNGFWSHLYQNGSPPLERSWKTGPENNLFLLCSILFEVTWVFWKMWNINTKTSSCIE